MTVSDLLNRYEIQARKHCKGAGWQYLAAPIHRLMGKIDISKLKRTDILQAVRAREGEGVKPSTIQREFALLRAALNYAVDIELLNSTPYKSIKTGKITSRTRYLRPNEDKRLQKALSDAPEWLKLAVLIARHTGLRLSNITHLRRSDIDKRRKEIFTGTTKNGDPVMSPMSKQLYSAIRWTLHHSARARIIGKVDGSPVSRFVISKAFRQVCLDAGLEDFTFHDLRHDFCSKLVQNGVDLYIVKDLAGHRDLRATMRYAHLAPEQKRRAIEVL